MHSFFKDNQTEFKAFLQKEISNEHPWVKLYIASTSENRMSVDANSEVYKAFCLFAQDLRQYEQDRKETHFQEGNPYEAAQYEASRQALLSGLELLIFMSCRVIFKKEDEEKIKDGLLQVILAARELLKTSENLSFPNALNLVKTTTDMQKLLDPYLNSSIYLKFMGTVCLLGGIVLIAVGLAAVITHGDLFAMAFAFGAAAFMFGLAANSFRLAHQQDRKDTEKYADFSRATSSFKAVASLPSIKNNNQATQEIELTPLGKDKNTLFNNSFQPAHDNLIDPQPMKVFFRKK